MRALLFIGLLVCCLAAFDLSQGITIAMQSRCPCRHSRSVQPSTIKKLDIFKQVNCPIQVIAVLKKTGERVCVNPKMRWLRQVTQQMRR
ncbi:stromal cell-derived factor 1-like [Lethenteron reissneri]|uniref:stromal cell-derived factor 1-like n=1 Tax=Lethenteron reissneri TaxID=7753 RepID=UPI002AB64F5B|nr:stromal cell-derived factor 1-like [Lethenteron reissneri]